MKLYMHVKYTFLQHIRTHCKASTINTFPVMITISHTQINEQVAQVANCLTHLNNCIHHLLPPPCDTEITSQLRRATTYPKPRNCTNCYKSFIHYALIGLYHSPRFIIIFSSHFISCLALFCCTVHYCLFSFLIFCLLATSSTRSSATAKSYSASPHFTHWHFLVASMLKHTFYVWPHFCNCTNLVDCFCFVNDWYEPIIIAKDITVIFFTINSNNTT